MPKSRTVKCECGNCPTCKRRAYHQAWKERNPDYYRNYYDHRDPARIERRNNRGHAYQWTTEQDELLGTDSDAAIGAKIGIHAKSVAKRRAKLGIAHYRKGGAARHVNKDGYVSVSLERHDPMTAMCRRGRHVMEHRLVMAQHLGRPLTIDEFVHHRNGIKNDNRINNLELWTRAHPDGQRVEDKLKWAHEFIARYDNEFTLPTECRFWVADTR